MECFTLDAMSGVVVSEYCSDGLNAEHHERRFSAYPAFLQKTIQRLRRPRAYVDMFDAPISGFYDRRGINLCMQQSINGWIHLKPEETAAVLEKICVFVGTGRVELSLRPSGQHWVPADPMSMATALILACNLSYFPNGSALVGEFVADDFSQEAYETRQAWIGIRSGQN